MKKIKTIGLTVTLLIFFFGCDKINDPAGLRNAGVVPVITEINPGIFDSKDLANSYVEFKVKLDSGTHADKAVVVGSFKDNMERVNIAEISSFPATVKIVSGDVLQKLGITAAQVENGDVFTFEVLTTSDGLTTRSNAILKISVACAYDKALATGSYHSVSPASDWNSSGDITLTADPDDPYTIKVIGIEAIEGLNEDMGPLVMHIDPATYEVTADPSKIASDAWGYGYIAYSGSGVYNSCDGSYSMDFDIYLENAGAQGKYHFEFTRN